VRAFVNAANVTAAGPRAVVERLLPALGRAMPADELVVAAPDLPSYRALDWAPNTTPVFWPRTASGANDGARLRQLMLDLPRAVRSAAPDVCLTLGDIGPLALPCPHVIFVHLALLVYSPGELAGTHAWDPVKRAYLEWHFGRSARRARRIIVQTPVMAARLARRYGIPPARIVRVPQPPPHRPDGALAAPAGILATDKPLRLLFLAAFYAHKNHALLPALAAELRRRRLDQRVHIFTTIDEAAPRARATLERIRRAGHVVSNLGGLDPASLQRAWLECSALFLPTLVESFGLPYLEAMAFGKRILTSDRDFARWMCGDLARYFEPLDAASAADAIEAFANESDAGRDAYVRAARERLAEFPASWDEVAHEFGRVLGEAVAESRGRARTVAGGAGRVP
jgi:glycosyltransferase involved in cell wall biosynthesis